MLLRNLLSLGFVDEQTSHGQAIIGTPVLVPVPKIVMLRVDWLTRQK